MSEQRTCARGTLGCDHLAAHTQCYRNVKASPKARVLLLWLVARKHGLTINCSAQHEDALYVLRDPAEQFAELKREFLAADDGPSWAPTELGERLLRGEPLTRYL